MLSLTRPTEERGDSGVRSIAWIFLECLGGYSWICDDETRRSDLVVRDGIAPFTDSEVPCAAQAL